jgi:hypothetical protein
MLKQEGEPQDSDLLLLLCNDNFLGKAIDPFVAPVAKHRFRHLDCTLVVRHQDRRLAPGRYQASTYRRDQLRGRAYRIRNLMCREKIHLFENPSSFEFVGTDADRPVVPGELFSASGWIACYPQAPHRAAAGAAFQVRHIEVRILSRRLIGFEPPRHSEFLSHGLIADAAGDLFALGGLGRIRHREFAMGDRQPGRGPRRLSNERAHQLTTGVSCSAQGGVREALRSAVPGVIREIPWRHSRGGPPADARASAKVRSSERTLSLNSRRLLPSGSPR